MIVEGRGIVPPKPVAVRIDRGAVLLLRFAAKARHDFRKYGTRSDDWGKGFAKSPIFTGLCGEHALCDFLKRRTGEALAVDTRLRKRGDGGADVVLWNTTIQVKTRRQDGRNLIRRIDERGRTLGMECDAFVFAALDAATDTKTNAVHLLGWIDAEKALDVGKLVRAQARGGRWWNLEIDDEQLEPIGSLPDRCIV